LSTPKSHRMPRVPSESTATALLPHRPRSMPPTCIPPTCRAARSRAHRSDPPRPHVKTPLARRGHAQSIKIGERRERARHTPRQRIVAEVAAHPKRTRPLGGATPHPQQPCAPTAPAHRAHMPLEYSSVTSRAPRSPLRAPQRPCCRTAPARCPKHASPRHAARSEQSRPIPTLLGRTCKRRWQEGATHSP
jgi:hypothetical protein